MHSFPIKRSYIVSLHDILAAALSLILSFSLQPGEHLHQNLLFLPLGLTIFITLSAVIFHFLGLRRRLWHDISLQDLITLGKATSLVILSFLLIMWLFNHLENFSRTGLFINWLMLFTLLAGPRILYCMIINKKTFSSILTPPTDHTIHQAIPVLLVGINDAAIKFIRESGKNPGNGYQVIAIADDNDTRVERYTQSIRIYGHTKNIAHLIEELEKTHHKPQRIILSTPHRGGALVRDILAIAEKFGLTVAKLPQITDPTNQDDPITLNPITIEDVLSQSVTTPPTERRKKLIHDKTVLVTGAGGSIGCELVTQIARYQPKKIILFELSEYNLYKIDLTLARHFPDIQRYACLGDISNKPSLKHIFLTHKPQIVFHTAALKHVPLLEDNIHQAVTTNILGSKHIIDLAIEHKAEKMILFSTDKAVNPTSVMGATKRIAELYALACGQLAKHTSTGIGIIRFGNVVGSSGSVIPLFQEQLQHHGPITITHSDMKRYFMLIPEATELVLQASTLYTTKENSNTSVFVLDMGQPIRIKDLVTQMIRLAGLTPGKDIKLKYIGTRPGEKREEELFYADEQQENTIYSAIMVAHSTLNHAPYIIAQVEKAEIHCQKHNINALLAMFKALIPSYQHPTLSNSTKEPS